MFVVSENTTVLGFNQTAQEDTQSTTIDLNALKKELAANASVSQPQNINITVNLSESEISQRWKNLLLLLLLNIM